jgi:hypothetical protein
LTALPVRGRTRRTLNRTCYDCISKRFPTRHIALEAYPITYSLAQRSALTNSDLVTLLNTESGGNVRSEVLVSLLVSGVFGDEVEVFSADDEGTVHLGRDDGSGQDTATDGDETGEGALLVCRCCISACSVTQISSLFAILLPSDPSAFEHIYDHKRLPKFRISPSCRIPS